MSLADATSIKVVVQNPVSPFGGVQVSLPERDIQVELNSNPAAVQSVFGRSGDVIARLEDFESFYAPLDRALPTGGLEGQIITKLSSAPNDAQWSDPPTTGLSNPTALIGMSAINGSALTGLRSDGAPAINPAIVPDWTGLHTFHVSPAVPTPTLNQQAANKAYVDSAVGGGITPAAFGTTDDTNITALLVGTPLTSLLQPVNLHLGWTGTLSKTRGGTGQSNASVAAHSYFGNNTGGAAPAAFNQIDYSELTGTPTPAALSTVDDTNVTALLVGTPLTALLQSVSLHLGWTGTLAKSRGGLGGSAVGIAAHTFFGNNTGSAATAAFVQPSASDLSNGITGSGSVVLGTGPTIDSPTISTGLLLSSAPLTLSGNISSAAWGTGGLRIKGNPATLTDTTSSGTVSAAFTNVLGGNTIAASSLTTFTDYVTLYCKDPVDGSNVTLTNKWALGAESLRIGTSNQLKVSNSGVLTLAAAAILGTPASGNLANCTFPTLNQNTTGSAASLSISGQSGLLSFTGLASTNRIKTLRDAADTILELGGSYTPTGSWTNLTMVTPILGTPQSGNLANCTFPTLNQNTTGSAAKWTTARNLAGNSVDGSANVAFANKFIVQGTTDTGLSAAQFLGALGTGILLNTTTTGILSIAAAGDFPTLNQNTTGSAASLSISGQTALLTFLGPTSTNRAKTLRDAADTILELGGSYTPTGTWTSLTMVTPVLGVPASGTLTNCTGLPIAGLAASTSTALGVGSIELGHASDTTIARSGAGAITVEGVQVLLSGAALGTPSSGTASNLTGLPVSTGISGLGTGVAAALAVNNNAAGGYSPIDGTASLTNKTISGSTNTLADSVTVTHDLTAVPNQTGGWTEYFVTGTDFTTTNTGASLVDITGLVTGTLTNSAWYEFEFVIRLLNGADANGMKIAIHGAGSGTAAAVFCTLISNTSATASANTIAIGVIDTATIALVAYSLGEGVVTGRGHFRAASAGTATMSLQLVKVTGNTATCRVGSTLRIKKAHT